MPTSTALAAVAVAAAPSEVVASGVAVELAWLEAVQVDAVMPRRVPWRPAEPSVAGAE